MPTWKNSSLKDRGTELAALLVLLALGLPQFAGALINPRYTVVDLVRDSKAIAVLRVSTPQDGQVRAEVVEMLAGAPLPEKALLFDFSEAEDLTDEQVINAFGGADTAPAVMCIGKRTRDGETVGALEIGTTWMGITEDREQQRWKLDRDTQELETVWASAARALVPAVRYTLTDPTAAFPVTSELTWARDAALGKLPGLANGCLLLSSTTAAPPVVVVLSLQGDRVFQAPTKGAPLRDVTEEMGLTSGSRAMAAGDLDGDGRVDLASWDGARVRLLLRGADGHFGKPSGDLPLADVRSLNALHVEGQGCGLVVGGADGITILASDGKGGLTVLSRIRVDEATALGAGGVCTVADINGDGAPDVLQAFTGGLVCYRSVLRPGAPAPAVVKCAIVANPTSIVCADYDTDGQLDLMVGGEGGLALVSRDEAGQWHSRISETGELGAAVAVGDDMAVSAISAADVNGDGRQGIAMFRPKASPTLFFNRGFACFGLSRTLTFTEMELEGAVALGGGQSTGMVADLDGDSAPDLLGADPQGAVWVLHGKASGGRRFPLTVTLADPARGPLTVTAAMGERRLGIWVVRPGEPSVIGVPRPGKLALQWKGADGTAVTREVVVTVPTAVAL